MEPVFVVNNRFNANAVNPTDLYNRLPFKSINLTDYLVSNTSIWTGNELHQQKICRSQYFGDKSWRIYFCEYSETDGSHVYALEASTPMDDWSIITDENGQPREIITRTEDWEDATYKIGGIRVVEKRHDYKGVKYNFLGFYTYKDDSGYYKSAVARSVDGLVWEHKMQLVLDDKMLENISNNMYLNCAFYDWLSQKIYAAFHTTRKSDISTTSGGISLIAESTDGVNWSYVGVVEPLDYCGIRGEDSIFSTLQKFGNLFVGISARYDYSEAVSGANNKNLTIHYSLDGKNWLCDTMPMLQNRDQAIRDVSIWVTNNSIYFTWLDSPKRMWLSRIEASENPPIMRKMGNVNSNNTESFKNSYYINGDSMADLYVKGFSSTHGQVQILIYSVLTDNKRQVFEEIVYDTRDIEVNEGNFTKIIKDVKLPHLANIKILNKTEGVIENVIFEVQRLVRR